MTTQQTTAIDAALECASCGQVEELRHMTHSDTEPVYGWVCPACAEELGDRDPYEWNEALEAAERNAG